MCVSKLADWEPWSLRKSTRSRRSRCRLQPSKTRNRGAQPIRKVRHLGVGRGEVRWERLGWER